MAGNPGITVMQMESALNNMQNAMVTKMEALILTILFLSCLMS